MDHTTRDWTGEVTEIVETEQFDLEAITSLIDQYRGSAELSECHFVTNDEYLLQLITDIRSRLLGTPSKDWSQYTDKKVMRELVSAAGDHQTVRYVGAETINDSLYEQFLGPDSVPVKLLAKPRCESNNRGIQIIENKGELEEALDQLEERDQWLIEEFCNDELWHSNAIVTDGNAQIVQVCRYFNSPLKLAAGEPIGSITMPCTDSEVRYHQSILDSLDHSGSFVTHLEYFKGKCGERRFLEIAGRAPGGLVSEMAERACGVQLESHHLQQQMGQTEFRRSSSGETVAWMWIPSRLRSTNTILQEVERYRELFDRLGTGLRFQPLVDAHSIATTLSANAEQIMVVGLMLAAPTRSAVLKDIDTLLGHSAVQRGH